MRRLLKAYPNDWQVWLAREGSDPECISTQVRSVHQQLKCWGASFASRGMPSCDSQQTSL